MVIGYATCWEVAVLTIVMREFGSALVTRKAGNAAYNAIVAKMVPDEVIVFDFDGVDTITNSFADEVFGRLAFELGMDELRKRTTFRNVSPFWARVIRTAMDTRASQREIAAVC